MNRVLPILLVLVFALPAIAEDKMSPVNKNVRSIVSLLSKESLDDADIQEVSSSPITESIKDERTRGIFSLKLAPSIQITPETIKAIMAPQKPSLDQISPPPITSFKVSPAELPYDYSYVYMVANQPIYFTFKKKPNEQKDTLVRIIRHYPSHG